MIRWHRLAMAFACRNQEVRYHSLRFTEWKVLRPLEKSIASQSNNQDLQIAQEHVSVSPYD